MAIVMGRLRRFRCAWCGRWLGPFRGRCPWFANTELRISDNPEGKCEWWWN